MTRLPLVTATLVVAGGMLAGLQWPVPEWGGPLLVPAALAGAAAAALVLLRPSGSRRSPIRPAAAFLLTLLAAGGALNGVAARRASDRSCLVRLPDRVRLELVGTVASVAGERLRLHVDTVRAGGMAVACAGVFPARLGGRTGAPPETVIGQRMVAAGRWWSPPGEARPIGRPGTFLIDSLSVVGPGSADASAMLLDRLRRGGARRVDGLYGAQGPLAASLLLAQRDRLDREVRDRFARAGLSHLLAISGLHVGLVAGGLLLLVSLLRLGRRPGAIAAAAGTVAYVAFLGAPHSAVRAALQIVLLLSARLLQRPTRSAALVAAAALVLMMAEPAALLSPGFQLSFAGVAGILGLRRPLLRRLSFLEAVRLGRLRAGAWLADGLATSMAATLATAPIVAWHFGQLAPVGILANLVAIPLLALTLPAVALPLLVSVLSTAAASFLAGPGTVLLGTLDRVADAASRVPGGTAAVTGWSAVLLTVAVAAGWAVGRRIGRVRPLVRGGVWAGTAAVVLVVAPVRPHGDRVELHMIDVGQGDAFAIRTPASRWLLIDAGIGGRDYDAGERRVLPYLERRGVRRLEALVLTHPDADHTGGAAAVIRGLGPRWVGDPAVVAGKELYLDLLRTADAAGVPWVGLERGVELELDGVAVEILYPDRTGAAVEDANDASVVLRVAYGEFSAILTGDAPASVERRLVDLYGSDLEAEVLKVGHHGSSTSTSDELLAATGARYALISAGRGNRYGHPHVAVVRRLQDHGVRVLRSDRHGSVVVRGDPTGSIEVRTERGEAP